MATTTKNMQVVAGNANASVTAQVTDSMPGVPCPGPAGYKYKGLRYVPVFADPIEWNSANSYEALTIVEHQGNSYTSKQAVPTGIDISNEEFWALTGNYNAQVEQYRQEVKTFDGRIQAIETEIPTIKSDISANTEAIANNKTAIDSMKTFGLYIGNSYTDGIGAETYGRGLYELTKDLFDNTAKKTSGGVGFAEYKGHPTTFVTLLDNAIADSTIPNNEVTHVLVNAAWGESNLIADEGLEAFVNKTKAAMANFKTKAKSAFPKLERVVLFWCESRRVKDFTWSFANDNVYSYDYIVNDVFNDLGNKTGIEYAGWIGWPIFFKQNCFSSDDYHPNNAGYTILSSAWRSAFFGNFVPEEYYQNMTFNLDNVIPGLGTITTQMELTTSGCTIYQPFIYTSNVADTFTPAEFNTTVDIPVTVEGIPPRSFTQPYFITIPLSIANYSKCLVGQVAVKRNGTNDYVCTLKVLSVLPTAKVVDTWQMSGYTTFAQPFVIKNTALAMLNGII